MEDSELSMSKSELSHEVVEEILIEEVFPALKISVPLELIRAASQHKEGSLSSARLSPEGREFKVRLNKFVDNMIDLSGILEHGKINVQSLLQPADQSLMIKFIDYFNSLHNFYFNQLRLES